MESTKAELKHAARAYKRADHEIEQLCVQNGADPIKLTVQCYKNHHSDVCNVGQSLRDVVGLYGKLVQEHGMDADDVRAILLETLL